MPESDLADLLLSIPASLSEPRISFGTSAAYESLVAHTLIDLWRSSEPTVGYDATRDCDAARRSLGIPSIYE